MEPLRSGDPTRIGRYRLLGRLGAGGLGQVFAGESPEGGQVAVRLLLNEYAGDRDFRARFARELPAARKVTGFHTAQVLDADPEANPPWLVTAYIPGPSLAAVVKASGPLSPAAVAVLGAALAEGLSAIHAQGLVHRDLKPGNIILADGGPRIIDFGVGRGGPEPTALTDTGDIAGTIRFMSPEQIYSERIRAASDVFSLGSVLAYAANGRSPFDANSISAVMYRIRNGDPDLGGLPEPLRAIIAACLAKVPAERPSPENVTAWLAAQNQIQDPLIAERPVRSAPLPAHLAGGGVAAGAGAQASAGGTGTAGPGTGAVPPGPASLGPARAGSARPGPVTEGATFTATVGAGIRLEAPMFPSPTVPVPAVPDSMTWHDPRGLKNSAGWGNSTGRRARAREAMAALVTWFSRRRPPRG